MQGTGDRVLARPVLAQDQDVCVRFRHLLDRIEDGLHRRRRPDHVVILLVQVLAHLLLPRPKVIHFQLRPPQPRCRRQGGEQLLVLPRLQHEVRRPLLDRRDRRLHAAERRDEDDDRVRVDLQDPLQPDEPLATARRVLREVHVEEDDVVAVVLEDRRDRLGIAFRVDRLGVRLQQEAGREQDVLVVVHHQDSVVGLRHLVFRLAVAGMLSGACICTICATDDRVSCKSLLVNRLKRWRQARAMAVRPQRVFTNEQGCPESDTKSSPSARPSRWQVSFAACKSQAVFGSGQWCRAGGQHRHPLRRP